MGMCMAARPSMGKLWLAFALVSAALLEFAAGASPALANAGKVLVFGDVIDRDRTWNEILWEEGDDFPSLLVLRDGRGAGRHHHDREGREPVVRVRQQ